jgi:hypothetical protein
MVDFYTILIVVLQLIDEKVSHLFPVYGRIHLQL